MARNLRDLRRGRARGLLDAAARPEGNGGQRELSRAQRLGRATARSRLLADNCADLIRAVEVACDLYLEAGRAGLRSPFRLFLDTYPEIDRRVLASDFNRLGASFGSSMLERAVIDALGRLLGKSYFELVRDNDLGIELGAISPELAGREIKEFVAARPLERLHVLHTVGLVDPITAADVAQPVADGLPETFEHYLQRDGIRYLKIKVAGTLDEDVARLEALAEVMYRRHAHFRISLDGNEQYQELDGFWHSSIG